MFADLGHLLRLFGFLFFLIRFLFLLLNMVQRHMFLFAPLKIQFFLGRFGRRIFISQLLLIVGFVLRIFLIRPQFQGFFRFFPTAFWILFSRFFVGSWSLPGFYSFLDLFNSSALFVTLPFEVVPMLFVLLAQCVSLGFTDSFDYWDHGLR